MKRIPLYISSILLTVALTGCSQQDSWDEQNTNNKELVAFRAGIFSQSAEIKTRSTGGENIAFTKENTGMKLYASATWKNHGTDGKVTKIVAATLSDKKQHTTTGNPGYNDVTAPLYWDDFGAGDFNNCETANDLTTTPVAKVGLTVYGIAVDGAALPTRYANITTEGLTAVTDEIPSAQSTGINTEDVVISNNISNNVNASGAFTYVKRSTASRELVFKHIYNKITLNFVHGNGFVDGSGKAEALPAATSVTLPNYNMKGTLNITTGKFSSYTTGTVTTLHKLGTATTDFDHTYEALTLPGREFKSDGTTIALTFNFGGNTYSVTEKEIYDALSANGEVGYSTMTSGVHYVFNITVHKTDVKLSATIANWTTVNADLQPSNGTEGAFASMTKNFGSKFDLYMGYASKADAYSEASAKTGYLETTNSVQTAFVWDKDNGKYVYATGKPVVYWPNNSTYYHFRAVANGELKEDAKNGDYVTLTTKQTTTTTSEGSETSTDAYADVIWGAPYTKAEGSTTSTINPALGPTSNEIKLEFFHKMAEVSFIFQTTEGSDKVDLTTAAPTVVLNCINKGKVLMQNGTVSADTTKSNYTLAVTSGTTTKFENISVVPQSTSNNTLKITTNDGNVYLINDLSKIKVTGKDDLIANWTEGTKYVYTITLKKSGVSITAQIKNWATVTAADETVVIQ